MIRIKTSLAMSEWHEILTADGNNSDVFIFSKNIKQAIWFSTRYLQFLACSGNFEVIPLYGKLINNAKNFIYQANYSLPASFLLKKSMFQLYDLLLNFETEPLNRFLFWNDADHLFRKNKEAFDEIFQQMVFAAYLNRVGQSTIKEDSTRYKVNQRNFFFFNDTDPQKVAYLWEKEYLIRQIDGAFKGRLDCTMVELVRESS